MSTKVNYTPEMLEAIQAEYIPGMTKEEVTEIAEKHGKNFRSVVAVLSRAGVYQAPAKPAKAAKKEGPTKKEVLAALDNAGFDTTGLDNATIAALQNVLDLVLSLAVDESEAAAA